MASAIRFWFRGEVVEVDDVAATTSVLHWLRESGASRGTKEGCNQGDCGACTVVVGTLVDGRVRVTTANSCLMLMPMLDGRALFTVEDVGAPASMHRIQQALVDHGGSQCGFCTPGFVMSLWRLSESGGGDDLASPRERAATALTGNLCRCTGYRPILDAAEAALADGGAGPTVVWDRLAIDLEALADAPALQADFLRPDSEVALAAALAQAPDARIIAGGTDLVVAMRATGEELHDDVRLVSVAGVPSLALIDDADVEMTIGAAVPLEDAWSVLAQRLPTLERMWHRFASPAIRSMGTVGGNIANASPIADLVPVLIALDADVEARSASGSRRVSLESFATGVRSNVLQPGEFLARVRIPASSFDQDVRAHKVSRRFDDDISSVSGVFVLRRAGNRITDVRAVFGGLAMTVRRAPTVEAVMQGQAWTRETLAAAQEALSQDFSPIDDHRASGWYRRQAASGLLERWWLETSADAPSVDHDVWAVR